MLEYVDGRVRKVHTGYPYPCLSGSQIDLLFKLLSDHKCVLGDRDLFESDYSYYIKLLSTNLKEGDFVLLEDCIYPLGLQGVATCEYWSVFMVSSTSNVMRRCEGVDIIMHDIFFLYNLFPSCICARSCDPYVLVVPSKDFDELSSRLGLSKDGVSEVVDNKFQFEGLSKPVLLPKLVWDKPYHSTIFFLYLRLFCLLPNFCDEKDLERVLVCLSDFYRRDVKEVCDLLDYAWDHGVCDLSEKYDSFLRYFVLDVMHLGALETFADFCLDYRLRGGKVSYRDGVLRVHIPYIRDALSEMGTDRFLLKGDVVSKIKGSSLYEFAFVEARGNEAYFNFRNYIDSDLVDCYCKLVFLYRANHNKYNCWRKFSFKEECMRLLRVCGVDTSVVTRRVLLGVCPYFSSLLGTYRDVQKISYKDFSDLENFLYFLLDDVNLIFDRSSMSYTLKNPFGDFAEFFDLMDFEVVEDFLSSAIKRVLFYKLYDCYEFRSSYVSDFFVGTVIKVSVSGDMTKVMLTADHVVGN